MFGKKEIISLLVYAHHIEGNGKISYEGKLTDYDYNIKFSQIKEIGEIMIGNSRCLSIDFSWNHTIVQDRETNMRNLVLPCLEEMEDAKKLLLQKMEEQREIELQEQEQKQAQTMEIQRHEEECRKLY